MTTFYLVISDDGLEGSFLTAADAVAYAQELREIGVQRLRIEIKTIVTTTVSVDSKGVES